MNEERCIDRFDKYMNHSGLNDNQVTKDAELSVGTIGKSRQPNRDLSNRVLNKLLQTYPNLNNVWLRTGEGSMLNSDTPEQLTEPREFSLDQWDEARAFADRMGVDLVPLYTEPFQAGNKGNNIITAWNEVESIWALPDIKADELIFVRGDSMEPTLPEGTAVAVKQYLFRVDEPLSIPFGEIFGIELRTSDDPTDSDSVQAFFKRIRKHPDHDKHLTHWIARSDNKDYEDFEIRISNVVRLWRIKASITIQRYN
jgi:phage repressor protein C with HTH and peptisase S24 domain